MAYSFIPTDHALAVKKWEAKLNSEYLDHTFWMKFAGMGDTNIIDVKEDLTKSKGDRVKFGIRSEIQGGRVSGANQGVGNEGSIEYYDFFVDVDEERQLVKKEHTVISNQRVAFELMADVRPALTDKNRFNLDDDITTAMTTIGTERVRGRYLYGVTDTNWDATHSTALANIDGSNDKMQVTMVEDAKIKAKVPTVAHSKIRPYQVKSGPQMGIQEWYVMLMHTYNARDLVRNDAAWKNAQLNIPPQTNMTSPIFTGSSFKGAWDGVLLYEWERIPLLSSTIIVSHCLFLGAQAGCLAWAMHPKFGYESQDIGHTQIFETDEIRGVKKVVWDRNSVNGGINNEDNAVINVFAAAVA